MNQHQQEASDATYVDSQSPRSFLGQDAGNFHRGGVSSKGPTITTAIDGGLPVTRDKQSQETRVIVERDESRLNKDDFQRLARRVRDWGILVGAIVMLVWPWIFWARVYSVGGVKMNNRLAEVVRRHPQFTTYFVTLVANFLCLMLNILFSTSVIRFSEEWMAEKEDVSLFYINLFSAFRHQSLPWTFSDLDSIFKRKRWASVILVCVCILSFQFIPSGIASLLSPISFIRTAGLSASELNFSSNNADCIAWGIESLANLTCRWEVSRSRYTDCLGVNELVDVLTSGRASMLSLLPDNTESLSFGQLGANHGLRVLGPVRGIYPVAPRNESSYNTLKPSVFTNDDISEAMLAYNYTLGHQGLAADISCRPAPESPISFIASSENSTSHSEQRYNGTCPEGNDFLGPNTGEVHVPEYAVMYWACRAFAKPAGHSYDLYLHGPGFYNDTVGNITCSLTPRGFVSYPTTFTSSNHVFSASDSTATSVQVEPIAPLLIEFMLEQLLEFVSQAQTSQASLIVETVLTTGHNAFGLPIPDSDIGPSVVDHYLPFFEKMILGMLEYETSNIRKILSLKRDVPTSCLREIEGTVSYSITGWFVRLEHIGFLLAGTLLSFVTLGLISMAIYNSMSKAPSRLNVIDAYTLVQGNSSQKGEEPRISFPERLRGVPQVGA
ncbi:hypothetical protein FA15DRAFT_760642 [Coprinopsis marcescibilis]|uniref:Uncharacterized protein n=1 Tax=Coprinopsis marcescibilis TaxID=230819 RepID=A0A5C3KEC5_COPMA|nr:hypothetical protein FA15DRAFT_760642 [Coprinopsis marcescibilis]